MSGNICDIFTKKKCIDALVKVNFHQFPGFPQLPVFCYAHMGEGLLLCFSPLRETARKRGTAAKQTQGSKLSADMGLFTTTPSSERLTTPKRHYCKKYHL